jgi:hypothetical protein
MNSAETKIHKAFRKASQYCTEGVDPSDALSKSVTENDLNADMTKRAAEMLNIYLTHDFMRKAKDKTASFPLADVPRVLKQAFINPVEPRSQSSSSSTVVVRKKKASATNTQDLNWAPKQEAASREIADLVEQLNGSIKLAEINIDELRSSNEKVVNASMDSYIKLVESFRESGKTAGFAEFEKNVISEYGSQAVQYMDNLAEILPNPTRFENIESIKTGSYFKRNAQHEMFDAFINGIEESKSIATKLAEFTAELSDMRSQRDSIFSSMSPASKKIESAADFLSNSSKLASVSRPSSSGVAHGAARFILKKLPGDPFEISGDATSKALDTLKSKGVSNEYVKHYAAPQAAADNEMANLQRAAILRDLITNDDIIAGHDPSGIQGAYNALLQLAPDATMNREVVRSFLRNAAAQQAIDPFTAKQVVDLQNEIMKQKGTLPSAPVTQ